MGNDTGNETADDHAADEPAEPAAPAADEVTVWIAAPADQLWDMVADVTRMGEWSPECYRCRWIGSQRRPVPGARFIGFNKLGFRWWATPNVVVEAERGKVFSFRTMGNRTTWSYRFQPDGSGRDESGIEGAEGTQVTEVRQPPDRRPWYARFALQFLGGARYDAAVTTGMQATLDRLKAAAES